MHTQSLVRIVSFYKSPPMALRAVSPRCRTAVEKLPIWYFGGILEVRMEPIPSQSHYDNHDADDADRNMYRDLQRSISFEDNGGRRDTNMSPYFWWLKHPSNHNVPIALRLPSALAIWEENNLLKISSERFKMFSVAPLSDVELYLQLDTIRSLTVVDSEMEDFAWLRLCPQLEELHLKEVRVKTRDFSGISLLKNLQILTMEEMWYVSSVDWIPACRALRELSFYDMPDFAEDLSPISHAEKLISLKIESCDVGPMEWLSECKNLQRLIFKCGRSRFPSIAHLKNLKYLEVNDCLNADLPISALYFTEPSELLKVDLSRNDAIEDIGWLSQCHQLQELSLKRCQSIVDFVPLGDLTALKILDIGRTGVSDIGWIAGCTSLEELRLKGCASLKDFTPIGTLKYLKRLNISENSPSESTATWLPRCTLLEHLEANMCAHIDFDSFGNLTMLRTLFVSKVSDPTDDQNPPTDAAKLDKLDSLVHCRLLEELCVSGRKGITDCRPLSHLQHLRKLGVCGTNITSIGCLAACPVLESFGIDQVEKVDDYHTIVLFPSLSFICFGPVQGDLLSEVKECLAALPHLRVTTRRVGLDFSGNYDGPVSITASY